MKTTSILLASAAAFSFASGAYAADAIVAAEPEALEYVRVCDSFGAGFFYIPGTETCLKISGYARFQVNMQRNNNTSATTSAGGNSDWDAFSRGEIHFDARNDTELGTLRSFIALRGDADNDTVPNGVTNKGVNLQQAFIELGGFRAGKFDTWWDAGLSGETDALSGGSANLNAVRYTYDAGAFALGLAVEELEGLGSAFGAQGGALAGTVFTPALISAKPDNNVGIAALLQAKFADVNFALLGGYDTDRGEGAIRGIATAALGSGTLGLGVVWSSAPNAYFAASEWAIAAEYAFQATERLKITPGVQWNGNLAQRVATGGAFNTATNTWTTAPTFSTALWSDIWSSNDQWKAGLTVDYKITNGLTTKLSAQYTDPDSAKSQWNGFIRLDRSF